MVMCLAVRSVEALSTSALITAALAFAAHAFPDKISMVMVSTHRHTHKHTHTHTNSHTGNIFLQKERKGRENTVYAIHEESLLLVSVLIPGFGATTFPVLSYCGSKVRKCFQFSPANLLFLGNNFVHPNRDHFSGN